MVRDEKALWYVPVRPRTGWYQPSEGKLRYDGADEALFGLGMNPREDDVPVAGHHPEWEV